jgi:hypothetical protein
MMTSVSKDWINELAKDRLIAEFSVWSADLVRFADEMARIEPHADVLHIDGAANNPRTIKRSAIVVNTARGRRPIYPDCSQGASFRKMFDCDVLEGRALVVYCFTKEGKYRTHFFPLSTGITVSSDVDPCFSSALVCRASNNSRILVSLHLRWQIR